MSHACMRLSRISLPLAALLATGAVALSIGDARAQGVTPFEVQKIIREGDTSAAATKKLDAYFAGFFGEFEKPGSGSKLPGLRKEFSTLVRVGDNAAHRYVNTLVYKRALAVVGSRTASPAAKYNALLLIGDLNQSDAANAIKPYGPSLGILKKALSIPADHDFAFFKPAALVGLQRFAEEKAIPAADVGPLTKELLKIVNEKDPPAGRSASAHNFVRGSAAAVLAKLGNLGPDNAVLKAFEAIMMDPNTRLTMRCEIMQYMGGLRFPPQAQGELQRIANLLGHQTIEICRQELERADADDRDPSRRILMYALYSGLSGMTGVYNAAAADRSGDAYSFIAKVRGKLSDSYRQLDDTEKTPDDQIATSLSTQIEEIQGVLLAKPAAPEPLVAAGAAQPQESRPARTN